MNKNKIGAASILIVFLLGMIGVMIGVSLVKTGYYESIMGRSINKSAKAYYAANSGIEDALVTISDPYNVPDGEYPTFVIDEATFKYTIKTIDENTKEIESIGTFEKYQRKIRVIAKSNWGFDYAIFTGAGGFDIKNNFEIIGDVYSNGTISMETGAVNANIKGNVWAVGDIIGGTNGVHIFGDAHANNLVDCTIDGNPYSPNIIKPNCTVVNTWVPEIRPPVINLPIIDAGELKTNIETSGTKFGESDDPENCILDGSGGLADCSYGTAEIGNIIIYGDLEFNENTTIAGPVYVTGNITFGKDLTINLDSDLDKKSQIVVTEGTIYLDKLVNVNKDFPSDDKFILFVSTYGPSLPPDEICNEPSITIKNNNSDVNLAIFYATQGCLEANVSAEYDGASLIGMRISITNNLTLTYNSKIKDVVFDGINSGNWRPNSFKEY